MSDVRAANGAEDIVYGLPIIFEQKEWNDLLITAI